MVMRFLGSTASFGVGVAFAQFAKQRVDTVESIVFSGLKARDPVTRIAEYAASIALGVGVDHPAAQLAGKLAELTKDPLSAALGSSGYTALGSRLSLFSGGLLFLLSGIGALYYLKTCASFLRYNKQPKNGNIYHIKLKIQKLSLQTRGATLFAFSFLGRLANSSLSLNEFSFRYFLLCMTASWGVGALIERSAMRAIFSDPRIQDNQRRVKEIMARNAELFKEISEGVKRDSPAPLVAPPDNADNEYDAMTCPITKMLINDPVIAGDGHAYERLAIQQWYDGNHRTCPLDPSKTLVNPGTLSRNNEVYIRVQEYIDGLNPMTPHL